MMPPVVTERRGDGDGPQPRANCGQSVSASPFRNWMAVITVLCASALVAVFTRGMIQRLLILVGLIVACLVYALLANVFGLGKRSILRCSIGLPWFGLPAEVTSPPFNTRAMMLIAPVAVIPVAENKPPKAVSGMTGRSMDPYMPCVCR